MPLINKCLLRSLLVAVNFVFFIISIAFVVLGTYISSQRDKYVPDFTPTHLWAPWILFGIGSVIAVASCIGCHAANLENRCIMVIYGAIMAVATLVMTTMAGVVYTHSDQIQSELAETLHERLLTYGIQDARYKMTWDNMQRDLSCCGIHSHQDWIKNSLLEPQQAVPDSCCRRTLENCGVEMSTMVENEAANVIFTDGCLLQLTHLLARASMISAAISILAATLFLVTILTTFFIVCDKKTSKEPTELISMDTLN